MLQRLLKGIRHDDLLGLAAEVAFQFLLSVLPFGVFVAALSASIAGLLHVSNPSAAVISALGDNLPRSLASTVKPELAQLLGSPRLDLLSAGAVGALIAAAGGTLSLVKGMHRAYDVRERRPGYLRFVVALGLTLLGALGIVASFATIVGGMSLAGWLIRGLAPGSLASNALDVLRWPMAFAWLTVAVAVVYRYAPDVAVPWRWIVAGSATFAVGWLLATALLGLYVERVANLGATYGSLAGVMVVMLWFYVTAAMLLLGAELTAALAWTRSPGEIRRRREEVEAERGVDAVASEAKGGIGRRVVRR